MKPPQFLLTIAIPTYNRLECLSLLLDSLLKDLSGEMILGEKIEILVCNNSSTDGTKNYLDSVSSLNNIRVIHHVENCGGDANIVYCCEAALGKFLWIIGDDDLPMRGSLLALISFLEKKEPDLLYLPATWKTGDLNKYSNITLDTSDFFPVSRMKLAISANVYVTFISSWVMNMNTYRKSSDVGEIGQFKGSSLSQLEWILTLLSNGKELYLSKNNWLFACAGASGNYSLFEVFSTNFNYIVKKKFPDDDEISVFLRRAMLWLFLPGLIWGVRNNNAGNFGNFDSEKTFSILNNTYGDSYFFCILISPMIKCNIRVANFFRYAVRVLAKCWIFSYKKKYKIT